MKNKQYSQFIVPNWLKWIIGFVCLVFISCLVYGVFLYQDIQQQKKSGYASSQDTVLSNTELTKVNNIYTFSGAITYHVLFGETTGNDKKIVFLPLDDEDEDITIMDQSNIISLESIKSQWKEQCNHCKLIKISPAMVNNRPLWEVTYRDNSDRHVLDYLSMNDGSRYERFRFKKTFK
ncbi:DUF5590 domain-containing protein [Virgibacillus byunsanensis]|uniref:DUF5590 domain-containing protein n=1 Tax=Virgibacillus byunsanensis TaxID=570945 RepID=A0ABW3LL54_9BACI